MADLNFNDVPKGSRIPAQIPLDYKTWTSTKNNLISLGINDQLAYTYYKGLRVYCASEKEIYEWREVLVPEETGGLVSTNFIYPSDIVVNGVNYSNKEYNFFKVLQASDILPTEIQAGTNVIITGRGTIENPYIINSTNTAVDGSETKINAGTNVTITGTGTIANPYIINSTDTNTPTLLKNSVTTTITGDGNLGSEYQIDINNLQKTIDTFPYTITDADDKYTIFVDNGASDVVINIPSGLKDNLACAFIQEGTGNVSFLETGLTILRVPAGLTQNIKGLYHWALLEKKLGDDTFYLGGSLKPNYA